MKRIGIYMTITVLAATATFLQAEQAKELEGDEEAIFSLKGRAGDSTKPSGNRKLYHWPVLTGLPYTSARFVEYPQGDICASRAFYWGRVIGSNGVQLSIRSFTPNAGDNQMAKPFVISEQERKTLTEKLKKFQQIYSKYGCTDNTLGFYMDKPGENESLEQFKADVYKYTRQRAELARNAGIPRMIIDMEWSDLEKLKEKIGPRKTCLYAWQLGKEVMRALNDTYPQVEFGFYPGLTGVQYNIENRINPQGLRFNTRVAFVQGLYDNRGAIKMFHFAGWTYNATDQCTGTKWWKIAKPPYVHDTDDAAQRIIYAHEQLLGKDIRFEWGRWELGGHRYQKPGVPGLAMIKLANVPLEALERTWKKLYEKSNVIWVWDHFNSWDEDGSMYVTIENETEMKGFDDWLAKVDPAYHKLYDAVTGKYWIPGTPSTGFHGAKRDLFEFHTRNGVTHITGRLDPQFVKYVNLTKELAGRDRDLIPLYTQQDVELAKSYKAKGFFPYQELKMAGDQPGVLAYLVPVKKTVSVLGHKLD